MLAFDKFVRDKLDVEVSFLLTIIVYIRIFVDCKGNENL